MSRASSRVSSGRVSSSRVPGPPVLLVGLLLLMASLWAGCDAFRAHLQEEGDGEVVGATDHEVEEAEGDSIDVVSPPDQREDLPERIYYDLTIFDWYRKGEPIVLDGFRYDPGKVEPTGERRFEREGDYEGVDYYIWRGGEGGGSFPFDTVYVPVYEGYWLPFGLVVDGAQGES